MATTNDAEDNAQMQPSQSTGPVIVLTGGGTGGHITPILAVAHELKKLEPNSKLIYIGDSGSKYSQLTEEHEAIDETHAIRSGKYRRYYGESWLKRLLDFRTNFLNLRDILYVAVGIVQAWVYLGKIKPDLVFLKGGFVGVPVGIAAGLKNIPIVTHDSDAVPGLANRLVSRWVVLHATAMPSSSYDYPMHKTHQVGVLVEHNYQAVTPELQASYKKQINLPESAQVVLVTGGSSGAAAINRAIKTFIVELLNSHPNLFLVHQAGKGKLGDLEGVEHERFRVLEFLTPMHAYMGAADVIVTRASANTLAEAGVQGKAAIAIPSPYLADGHQLRNAEYLAAQKAAIVVLEKNLPVGLEKALTDLLDSAGERSALSHKLQHLSPNDSAKKLAVLLINQIKTKP